MCTCAVYLVQLPMAARCSFFATCAEQPDILFFKDAQGNRTGSFYLDPELEITRRILKYLSIVRGSYERGQVQLPAVVSGLIKVRRICSLLLPVGEALMGVCDLI